MKQFYMGRIILSYLIFIACVPAVIGTTIGFGANENQFELEFVSVGNPGNAPDPDGDPFPDPLGSVPYPFHIAKLAISREMIEKANASSTTDGTGGVLGIDLMDLQFIGGDDGNSSEKPATGLSWNTAARFVNWLNTSTGNSPAYRFSTQPSDDVYNVHENALLWESSDPGYDPRNPLRNSLAKYVIPSLDEWYKAAYHDTSSGVSDTYFDYATGSDASPIPVASGTAVGTAVYFQTTPAPVHLAGGPSPYGTVGQSGNSLEVQESYPRASPFGDVWYRGGGWRGADLRGVLLAMSSESRFGNAPHRRGVANGLRVAMVPDLRDYSLFGDLDDDEIISPSDIDVLSGQIRLGLTSEKFDLNEDGAVDDADRALWIERAALTVPGDTDLNREVDFDDFLQLSHHFGEVGTWGTGDFNGNGTVDFPDFLSLSRNYQRTDVATAVPEPDFQAVLVVSLLTLASCRTRFRGRRRFKPRSFE